MELSGTSSNLDSSKTSIVSLPVDLWEHVFTFDIPNVCVNLILTGDKRVIAKMSRMSHLSLCWTSWRLVDWSKASPALRLLSKLKSLRLTTWSPLLKPRGPMNAGIFPSSLVRLDLRFLGASALLSDLNAPILLPRLVALEKFSLYEESTTFSNQISLSHFPASLRSLRLQSSDWLHDASHLLVNYQKLADLPASLETLHLHLDGLLTEPIGTSSITWPTNLSSVTDLALRLNRDQTVRFGLIAPRLKRLAFVGRTFGVGIKNEVDFTSVPIAQALPELESFHTNCYKVRSWKQLRDFPPTLTDLVVRIRSSIVRTPSDFAVLEQLNQDPACHLFAAPHNLRRLEEWENRAFTSKLTPGLLKHFPSLVLRTYHEAILENSEIYAMHLSDWTDARLNVLDSTKIKTLPPALTSLHVNRLYPELDNPSLLPSHRPRLSLHGLTTLKLRTFLPTNLVPLLPSTLETLDITVRARDADVLNAIAQSSHLANLKSLALGLDHDRNWSLNDSNIPTSLTSLEVTHDPYNHRVSIALAQHRHLTNVKLKCHFQTDFIPNLPSSLRSLTITLQKLIDLADPAQAMHLYGMSLQLPKLRSLHASSNVSVDSNKNGWLRPLSDQNAPKVTFAQWKTLPLPLMKLYAHHYLAMSKTGLFFGKRSLSDASELFALACLPRRLSLLWLPKNMIARRVALPFNISDPHRYSLQRILAAVVKYDIPLLGLFNLHRSAPHTYDRLVDALPPQLSRILIGDPGYERELEDYVVRNADGFVRQQQWSTQLVEPIYHAANAVAHATIALWSPSNWLENDWLRGAVVANALGSAIAAPLLLRRIHSTGVLQPIPMAEITTGTSIVFDLCVLTTLPISLLAAYGIGSTHVSIFGRSVAIISWLVLIFVRGQYFLHVRRSTEF